MLEPFRNMRVAVLKGEEPKVNRINRYLNPPQSGTKPRAHSSPLDFFLPSVGPSRTRVICTSPPLKRYPPKYLGFTPHAWNCRRIRNGPVVGPEAGAQALKAPPRAPSATLLLLGVVFSSRFHRDLVLEFENRFKENKLLNCGRLEELWFEAVEAGRGRRNQTFSTVLRNNSSLGCYLKTWMMDFWSPDGSAQA